MRPPNFVDQPKPIPGRLVRPFLLKGAVMQILGFLLARFSEPSSYAGLGALLALAGWHFPDSDIGQLAQFLAAGCGLAALLLKERGVIQMIALAAMLGTALGACSSIVGAGAAVGAAGTAVTVANSVSSTVDTTIQTACAAYEKGRTAANTVVATGLLPSDVTSKVSVIEEYGDAACANPPSGDALSTAIWLGSLVGQIATLTSSAPAT
jgi:hypothetical protein